MIRLVAILIFTISTAKAAPPPGPVDPEIRDWYRSLRQPNTDAGCCSIADCRTYVSRISRDHYEVYIHNRWFTVPNEIVLHRENKAGMAIACLRTQWSEDLTPPADYAPDIMCFVPGPET